MDYSRNKSQLVINYLISQLRGDLPRNSRLNSNNNIIMNIKVAHQNLHLLKEIMKLL